MARKLIVMHTGYGCDTGCCGHVIELDGVQQGSFDFGHPYSDDPAKQREYAEELIREQLGEEHVKDRDWRNSQVRDCDW